MKTPALNLCFFWHMHQPDYRREDGMMSMPWVFLHAIKDYYEMPWLLWRYKGLRASFNITAPLIEQINLYREPLKNDYFLSLWHKAPSELESSQREWLIKTMKSTQYETMIAPLAYLSTLYNKESLSDSELEDFELLFMLTWCGHYLRQENEVVKRLFKKEKGFTQSDKKELLESLTAFVATILPLYARLLDEGIISLSTTPYNHPILPLLLDMNNAKVANPHTKLVENPISLKADACLQIERAIDLYKKSFGKKPTGFWPAEGGVCEESVALYKEYGIEWIATDEAILFASLNEQKADNYPRENLYMPYDFNGVNIGFRDHGLSDLIGFTYRFKSAQNASEHFMSSLASIAKQSNEATVFVILDGENAWEFFPNNAYDFFHALYRELSQSSWCKTLTMDDSKRVKKRATLTSLRAGSWIHGNFDTWSGDSEKNRAWELIYQTKRDVSHHLKNADERLLETIESHFLAAECSDWFWWYGDDHSTEFASEFDTLFRSHLITIYRLLEINPPAELFIPINSHKADASFFIKPKYSISPQIDGAKSSFFEWLGCGVIDERKLYSTMDRVRGPIEIIRYAQDEESIYVAFEGTIASISKETTLLIITIEETQEQLSCSLDKSKKSSKFDYTVGDLIELRLSKSCAMHHTILHLRFELLTGEKIIQIVPSYGALKIDINEDYAANWFV